MKKLLKNFWNWFLGNDWLDALYHGIIILGIIIDCSGFFEWWFMVVV